MRTDDQNQTQQNQQNAGKSTGAGLNFDTPELQPLPQLVRAVGEILPTIAQGERVPPHLANAVEEAYTEAVRRFPQIKHTSQSGRATGNTQSSASQSGVSESRR